MSIIVNNISKRYGEQWAVKDVQFSIGTGEIVGFIGPNGAGKSTTMKIITGVIKPTDGNVLVNNLQIPEQNMEIRKIIGYLPESNPLYEDMYVKEYLQHVANLYGFKNKQASSKVDEIVEMVGLSREKHKKIGNLSKGYKQRVGLSQALIHDPEVLILDEPTSGLDPNQIVEIRNLISSVGKQKTILLSTHIMQEVEAICDRVIIIDQGTIKADEKASNLSHSDKHRQTIQIELEEDFPSEEWKSLDFISEVRSLPANTYLLATKETSDIRAKIFKFAVEKNLTILSMNQKFKSLEEAFYELTNRN